ncbi:MAG: NAD(P)(+) transhydrogenase (Re/Si-specific) subunit beta [Planctomycetales bacterium]|nr:NAD(P)(+) transhydrogenase (Re/Si-specific) subunit beta [Planctomycetales bacterium]
MLPALIQIAYIVAAALFIVGLKFMGHPRTAVRGNLLGAGGMGLAMLVTLVDRQVEWSSPVVIAFLAIGMLAGAVVGGLFAVRVPMTAMPQMVALFNGFGGAASVLVAGAELLKGQMIAEHQSDALLATALSGLIGAVTFWGSLVAFGKLQELQMFKKPLGVPMQQVVNAGLFGLTLLITLWMSFGGVPQMGAISLYLTLCLFASVLGLLLVTPIGGADMPVVIALLNSYSGLAAATTGFVINNSVLIIAGSLVGASGVILTQLMCKAMNRSLTNVLFGGMGTGPAGPAADDIYANVRSTSPDDIAMILDGAQRVVFVPGYGMAVAQAQHAVRDLAKLLAKKEIEVEYAIHPVAGRMPGHMNVLLAEADVPYEQLKEMDEANATMDQVDVAIVLGANDTVNPVAQTDPNCAIAGMPIIEVGRARTVIVIKRSLSPGFAGIPNPLFAADNTLMFFADGQKAILDINAALKQL